MRIPRANLKNPNILNIDVDLLFLKLSRVFSMVREAAGQGNTVLLGRK